MALKLKYSPLQKMSLENLYTAYTNLSPRNRLVALGVGIGVIGFVLLAPLSFISGQLNSLKKEIISGQKGQRQVASKIKEYEQVKAEIGEMERVFRGGEGSLTSRLEGIAREVGLTLNQLKEKSPQETDYLEINSVEVKITEASLPQLLDFFYKLENTSTGLMRIRSVQMRPRLNNRSLLDVSCEVATFVLKKEA